MILTITDILNLALVVFVGYIGQRLHKPRTIALSMSLIAISLIFCFGGSYFYFKDINATITTRNGTLSHSTGFGEVNLVWVKNKFSCTNQILNGSRVLHANEGQKMMGGHLKLNR